MIGPLTTPPITMAASSIPGRYLHRCWSLSSKMQKRTLVFQQFASCEYLNYSSDLQPNLMTKVTAKVRAPKKRAKILVRKAWNMNWCLTKLNVRCTCFLSDMLSLILAGMKSLSAIAARALRPVLIVLPRTMCEPEKE